jgi:antirestriction protein ArdC
LQKHLKGKNSFCPRPPIQTRKINHTLPIYKYSLPPTIKPHWLTALQAEKLGGRVKENEAETKILFWGRYRTQKESSDDVSDSPFMRLYTVYNSLQCEGISVPKENKTIFNPIEECERVIEEMPDRPRIAHSGNYACYWPQPDKIMIPEKNTFENEPEYYCTLFHELCHATGHETRLNRKSIKDIKPFGSEDYSREELIAEIGASFLCGITGIENKTINNSVSYIHHWIERLHRDKRLISMTAQQAQKAVNYIQGINKDESQQKPCRELL